jgi:hypothetical protein
MADDRPESPLRQGNAPLRSVRLNSYARTLYAVAGKGGGRSPAIIQTMSANGSLGMATSAPIGVPVGIEILGRPWTKASLSALRMGSSRQQSIGFAPKSTPPLPWL